MRLLVHAIAVGIPLATEVSLVAMATMGEVSQPVAMTALT